MTDILLVEDHTKLNTLMCAFLEKAGYRVRGVRCGEEALEFLEKEQVRLAILDVMLPGMDGFAVCAAIREKSSMPILFLSARVDKENKMNGFLLGADDYVEKPVDMDILLAKITALMRRNYDMQENALLVLLTEHPGKTLHKDFLFQHIWGIDSFSENQTLTVHIKTLRDKIEENPKKPERIQTVWGVGYRYEEV